MTPVFDPLAKRKNPKLPKSSLATPSPTDILAEEDPLARYTEAIRLLPNDKEKLKVRDKLPGFTTESFPDWMPQDLAGLYELSKQYDTEFFRQSDRDFAKRHPGLRQAERAFESRVNKEQEGDFRLSPAIRDAFLQSGLENALGVFGDTPGTIRRGPGNEPSAIEAAVAKNLGLGIREEQERTRRNALEGLTLAEGLYPHRQIGFGGETAVGITEGNVDNQNTYDFAKHAFGTGLDLFNWQINTGNIQQGTEQRNALAKAAADRLNAQATTEGADKAAKSQRNAAIAATAVTVLSAVAIAF